jgi:pentatricopeptide repeat protein
MLLKGAKPTKPDFVFPTITFPWHRQPIGKPTTTFSAMSYAKLFFRLCDLYKKLVQLSVKSGSIIYGKLARVHMIESAFKPCLFFLNNLLRMYCKSGDINTARQLFDKMPKRNVISYNSLISGNGSV